MQKDYMNLVNVESKSIYQPCITPAQNKSSTNTINQQRQQLKQLNYVCINYIDDGMPNACSTININQGMVN